MSFSILFVCTGNVCRSPMAELLTRAMTQATAELTVASAGMAALVGEGVDRSSAAALAELGIDPSGHRARQFQPEMAVDADLVLTAETAHRDKIMADAPSSFRRVFTMKEFARLAPRSTSTDRADIVAEVAWLRGADGSQPAGRDDMPDPFRARIGPARAVAEQVGAVVRITVELLQLAPDPSAEPEPVRRPSPRPRTDPR